MKKHIKFQTKSPPILIQKQQPIMVNKYENYEDESRKHEYKLKMMNYGR